MERPSVPGCRARPVTRWLPTCCRSGSPTAIGAARLADPQRPVASGRRRAGYLRPMSSPPDRSSWSPRSSAWPASAKVRRPCAHRPVALRTGRAAGLARPGPGARRGRGRRRRARPRRRRAVDRRSWPSAYVGFAVGSRSGSIGPAGRPARLRLLRRRARPGHRPPRRPEPARRRCSPGSPRCRPTDGLAGPASPTSPAGLPFLGRPRRGRRRARPGRRAPALPELIARVPGTAESPMTGLLRRRRDRRRRAAGPAGRRAAAEPRRDPAPPPRPRRRPRRPGAPAAAGLRTVSRTQFNVFPEVPCPGRPTTSCRPAATSAASASTTTRCPSASPASPHATLVAFLSGTCLTCQRFWDAFASRPSSGLRAGRAARRRHEGPGRGEPGPHRRAWRPPGVPLVMSTEAWAAYDVPGSPYFVLVDGPSGQARGEGTGIDWPQVRGLLSQVADDDVFASQLEARRVAKPAADDARERRVDAELMSAGIPPGDPSLYPSPTPQWRSDHRTGYRRAVRLSAHGITHGAAGGLGGAHHPAPTPGPRAADRRPGHRRRPGRAIGSPDEIPEPVVHLANFALPEDRGDFGSGAVDLMRLGPRVRGLFEYGPESVGQRAVRERRACPDADAADVRGVGAPADASAARPAASASSPTTAGPSACTSCSGSQARRRRPRPEDQRRAARHQDRPEVSPTR